MEDDVHTGWHKVWRVVRDGGERFCWVDGIAATEATAGPTPMGLPRYRSGPDTYAGYYWSEPVGKPCPDRVPPGAIAFP